MHHHRLFKRFLWVFVAVLLFFVIVSSLHTQTYKSEVVLRQKTFFVDVVDSPYLLAKGLSGRESMDFDHGMFFIFQTPGKYSFWMKDMHFPLDIIWIDENFKIVYIKEVVTPETYPETFTPPKDSLYVLEIKAGEVQKHGIKIGDTAKFLKN